MSQQKCPFCIFFFVIYILKGSQILIILVCNPHMFGVLWGIKTRFFKIQDCLCLLNMIFLGGHHLYMYFCVSVLPSFHHSVRAEAIYLLSSFVVPPSVANVRHLLSSDVCPPCLANVRHLLPLDVCRTDI